MAHSFTAKAAGALACAPPHQRRKVLVTGAAGNIGSYFAEHSHKNYDLRLMIRPRDREKKKETVDKIRAFGEIVEGELSELDKLKEFCRGVDTVVHLAANPSPNATWESVCSDNITGTYHLFVAAKSAGCRRVIYASSIHAVSGYPSDVQVKTSEPVNPGDLYGVSKCFGEALGRYMAEQENVSAICLRIGAFQPHESAESEKGLAMMDAWVSRRDLNQLIEKCIDNDTLKFAILHGLSDNRFKRLDISDARELVGYEPQDDLTDVNPKLKDLHLSETVNAHNVTDKQQKSGLRQDV
ncbi:MAG: uronate dehydrogenase [Phycisphaerales bacterium]|jgi:nucleoside-diphosphate-sugar epimerase|nr:uronate dehydrogenase [Phycisphaerales bacterium]